jgi:MYXO-CTERM domain-containing protein
MKTGLVAITAGAVLGLAVVASADPIVTLPFTLTAAAGATDSATSTLTLDAAAGYAYTFDISSMILNASVLGQPAPLNPVTENDVTLAELTDNGAMAAIPSVLFAHNYDSSEDLVWPNGFDFDVTYEALADGALRTTLHVNSFGPYKNAFTTLNSVTITGIATAEVIPVPAPAAGAAMLGLGGLALRRRRR